MVINRASTGFSNQGSSNVLPAIISVVSMSVAITKANMPIAINATNLTTDSIARAPIIPRFRSRPSRWRVPKTMENTANKIAVISALSGW